MVRIDIDIGNSHKAVLFAQVLGDHTTVIEHAKTGRVIASCVVQTRNRDECALCLALHDRIGREQYGTHDVGSRLENTPYHRRITCVEKALAFG